MLTACGTSGVKPQRPGPSTDPVIRVERKIEKQCPVELTLPLPAKPSPAPGATITGNQAGMEFMRDASAWGDLLFGRLSDAKASCPAPVPPF